MSSNNHNNINEFVHLRKLDKDGNLLLHLTFPSHATLVSSIADIPEKQRQSTNLYTGLVGVLRASHRDFGPVRSIHPRFLFHPHGKEEKITSGEVVRLETGIWCMDVDFEAREAISV